MTKMNQKAVRPFSPQFVAEVNRPDRHRAGLRISDAMELLDSLQWAAHKAMSDSDYWVVLISGLPVVDWRCAGGRKRCAWRAAYRPLCL